MADEIHVDREQEAGVRGGASAAAVYTQPGVAAPAAEAWLAFTDKVRWGPIWAGFLSFMSLWVWFSAIGLAAWSSSARTAGTAFGPGFGVWVGISALVALFIGGYIMSRVAGIAGVGNGVWNGIVLWALTFTLLLLLTSFGAGSIFGTLFSNPNVTSRMAAGGGATPGATGMMLSHLSIGSWWFVIFQFISLLLAAAGGAAGARPTVEEEHTH